MGIWECNIRLFRLNGSIFVAEVVSNYLESEFSEVHILNPAYPRS